MARPDGSNWSARPNPGDGRHRFVNAAGPDRKNSNSPDDAGPLAGVEKAVELNQDWAEAIFNLNQQTGLSEATLLDVTLDEVIKLSRSEVGYCHLIAPDQKSIQFTAWSKVIRAQCRVIGLPPHNSLDMAGAWADCTRLGRPVIHNEYLGLENKKDYPAGHYTLTRHASVPVYDAGKIVMILGVGNKPGPYDEADVARLGLVACNLWVVLKHRKAEKALHTSEEKFRHFEELVEQRMAELKSANEQLAALSHVKDEFVSNVSHELRTPLTSLKLHQHLLRQHPEELNERLDIMGRETDRLASTIEQLLQLSRLEQDRAGLRLAQVDLNRMVSKYVSDRAPLSHSSRLEFKAAPELPYVGGDENLLGEVLEICLSNAVKYTPAGGRITVRTCLRGSGQGRMAGFSVSDTGPGIDPAERPRLFERFFRGKAGRASAGMGSGLGLAIAREIVERHSGEIEVESSGIPGEGATFTIWLSIMER